MVKILVFGNPLIEKDSVALKITPFLKKRFPGHSFVFCSPEETEEFQENPLIIDTVKGINKCRIISCFKELFNTRSVSLHDFGLSETLLLLKKAGKIKGFKVIGIPLGYPEKKALKETTKLLKSILL